MYIKKWDELPRNMQNSEVRPYYEILRKKKFSLFVKRLLDIIFSLLFIIIFSPLYLILIILVAVDSGFPVFYLQKRVTQNGKIFKVIKFRSMVANADKLGSLVTVGNDKRVTRVGRFLRKFRLDELPQIFNVLMGDMTFVGTRPEVEKYVAEYTNEMLATLLLPAGVTSLTSILYKDEARLLKNSDDTDRTYIDDILPQKMVYNLEYLRNFSIIGDIKTVFKTVFAVLH